MTFYRLFRLMVIFLLSVMAACHPEQEGKKSVSEDAFCDPPPIHTVVMQCEFEDGNDCDFFPVGSGMTEDAYVTADEEDILAYEGAGYLSILNGSMSADPTKDGACVLLTGLCPGKLYSMTGFMLWEGDTFATDVTYSFGVRSGDTPEEALGDTAMRTYTKNDLYEDTWWWFASFGFEAQNSSWFCLGLDPVERVHLDSLQVYSLDR